MQILYITHILLLLKRLFHIHSKVSRNKTKQIKYNDINKNIILQPSMPLWLQTKWLPSNMDINKGVLSFEYGSTNQNQGLIIIYFFA